MTTETSQLKKGLTEKEWLEVISLEYVLTWNYTENYNKDELRYKELSNKWWEFQENKSINNLK